MWGVIFRRGLIAGLSLGAIVGFEIAGLGDLLAYARDTYLFVLAVAVVCAVVCIALYCVLGILFHLVSPRRENSEQAISRFLWTIGVVLIVWSQATFCFVEVRRPVSFRSPGTVLVILLLGVLSFVLAHALITSLTKLARFKRPTGSTGFAARSAIWVAIYLGTLLILSFSISAYFSRTPLNKGAVGRVQAKGKVLLLGLDAADWATLSPLIESGKLPNIDKLIKTGASGNLTSIISPWGALAGDSITFGIHSPTVWTSIVTGKSPSKHGISDFVFTEIPFIEHPFRHPLIPGFVPFKDSIERFLGLRARVGNRFMRKCKAAWNILTDAGLRVGALGWWDTWPAEAVNGVILSDRFANLNQSVMKKWSPPDLISREDVDSLNGRLETIPPDELQYYTRFPFDPGFRDRFKKGSYEYNRNELIDNFMSNVLLDKYRSQLGLALLREHEYALMGVYYYALDVAGHAFTRFRKPEAFRDVQQKDIDYFGGIIDKYYAWFDAEIGKYLTQVDENTTVIICSDHGMGPWSGAASMSEGAPLSGSHRKQGVFIMWGKHIREGAKVADASVLDILPTMLYLIGMPVGKDMDGSVIKEVMKRDFLSAAPIQEIETYETERYTYKFGPGMGLLHAGDAREIDRLKSLGYLK
jgi:hypothetical protein